MTRCQRGLKATKCVQAQEESHPRGTKLRRYDGKVRKRHVASAAALKGARTDTRLPAGREATGDSPGVREAQTERRSKSANNSSF